MNQIKKRDHVYDAIVIGAGLSGLVVAVQLIQKGFDICLLDSSDFPGGHSRLVYSPIGLVDNGLKFIPDNEEARSLLNQLRSQLACDFDWAAVENGPVTFNNGDIKPFVGFGKEAPQFHRQLAYFLEPKRLELSKAWGAIVSQLIAKVGDRFFPGSLVTKYLQGGDSKDSGQISAVLVNGQKEFRARKFIHAASPKILSQLLSDELISSKNRQKLAKADYWTVLGLDIFHRGAVTESQDLHVLNGTTQDEFGPCVGRFQIAQPTEKMSSDWIQQSQWLTFINSEDGEDPEVIGAALKKIKRQIKRAYPTALDAVESERIMVSSLAEADLDLRLQENGSFLGIDNLWVSHRSINSGLNILGSLKMGLWVGSQFANDKAQFELPSEALL